MKFLIISTILLTVTFNSLNISENINTPTTTDKLEEFLKRYSDDISENEINELNRINEKMKTYEGLTQEEIDFIRECEINAFKKKLGEAKYEEYRKLVEKMESDAEFTQPEKFRLYELLRELKSK